MVTALRCCGYLRSRFDVRMRHRDRFDVCHSDAPRPAYFRGGQNPGTYPKKNLRRGCVEQPRRRLDAHGNRRGVHIFRYHHLDLFSTCVYIRATI